MGGDGRLLAAQIIEILVIAAWVIGTMLPVFWLLNRFNMLRISPDDELAGLDGTSHGGSAYAYDDDEKFHRYKPNPGNGTYQEIRGDPAVAPAPTT